MELVIERSEWAPPEPQFTHEAIVPLRIAAKDLAIRNKAKSAGAKWNPEKQLWLITYGKVVGTELEKYIDRSEINKLAMAEFYGDSIGAPTTRRQQGGAEDRAAQARFNG